MFIDNSKSNVKRLMTLKEYASILMPSEFGADYTKINMIGAVTGEPDDFFAVQIDDDHFRIVPGPEFSPRLYRGQTEYFPSCKASIHRIKDYSSYIVETLKTYEFIKLLLSHPVVNEMANWVMFGKRFSIDLLGLSQHYEFKTTMLDFSRSKDIAMFFALCKKNKNNRYEPITAKNHQSVIYTLDIGKLLSEEKLEHFNVVGLQALPRPSGQKAFSVYLNVKENLNQKNYVKHEMIKVDKKLSEKYFEMFDGGEKLFPVDIMYQKAQEIQSSKHIDLDVIESLYKKSIIPNNFGSIKDFLNFLEHNGYLAYNKNEALTLDQKTENQISDQWGKNKDKYFSRVKYRLTCESL